MRLINTSTLKLEDHIDPGPYAILSHTWRDEDEVLYADYIAKRGKRKTGYKKVQNLCTQARDEQLEYVWIDTVCIDKSSSAELSEAINSMWNWYERATVCYVYLEDVREIADIEKSRWITRGWTLQELVAPTKVRFFNKDWVFLGTKSSLITELVRYTHIDQIALEDTSSIGYISVAARLSWAASRHTTRVEDTAYCLMGLFDVNMPLLYGEGNRAFTRLLEEILKKSHAESILAFDRDGMTYEEHNLLAPSPTMYGKRPKIINESRDSNCEVTNRGISIRLYVLEQSDNKYLGVLRCRYEFDPDHYIALPLYRNPYDKRTSEYWLRPEPLVLMPLSRIPGTEAQTTILLRDKEYSIEADMIHDACRYICSLQIPTLLSHGYEVIYAVPSYGIESWDPAKLTSEIMTYSHSVIVRKFALVHRLHGEAFIIKFATVKWDQYGNCEELISVKTKPKTLNCDKWLQREGMYEIMKEEHSPLFYEIGLGSSTKPSVVKVEGEVWKYLNNATLVEVENQGHAYLYGRVRLKSGRCFRNVTVKLLGGGIISVEPGGHVVETGKGKRKTRTRR